MNIQHHDFLSGIQKVKEDTLKCISIKITKNFEVELRNNDQDCFHIPIIINSFNRQHYLEKQISRLQEMGYKNLYVIDNNSTYQPLLDFYLEKNLRVFYLSENIGYLALWKSGISKHFDQDFFVYTDSDVVPDNNCPNDFLNEFIDILNTNSVIDKVGFSLALDDLPENNLSMKEITDHESKFWIRFNEANNAYVHSIDTTFALYKPGVSGAWWIPSVRMGPPYIAKHLPWYESSNNLTADDLYYYSSIATPTHWGKKKSFKSKILECISILRS